MAARRGDSRARSSSRGRFGVSQGTVRKAIDALAADNLVVRRQGKGTFVATHTEEQASLFRFLRIRRNDGARRVSGEPPPRRPPRRRRRPRSRALLDLKPGEPVHRAAPRARVSAASRWCSTRSRCPRALFRGLTKARLDAYRGSMYGFFETAVRRADAEGAGEAPRRRRRRGERRGSSASRPGDAAARGRSRDADLRRPAGRSAARPVRDARAPLPQRARLTSAARDRVSRRCAQSSFRSGDSARRSRL